MRYIVFECNGEELIRLEFQEPLRLEHLYEFVEEIAAEKKVEISTVSIRFVESKEQNE